MDFTRFRRRRLQAERPTIESVVEAPRSTESRLVIEDGVVRVPGRDSVPPTKTSARPPAAS